MRGSNLTCFREECLLCLASDFSKNEINLWYLQNEVESIVPLLSGSIRVYVTGIHCSVPLSNEQEGEERSRTGPQSTACSTAPPPAPAPAVQSAPCCLGLDTTTAQHIISTAWTKPNALYKTKATLKHYVTETAQAFKDSPERLMGCMRMYTAL